MSSKSRLSKRESTAALRQDTLPPSTGGRKRSGSVVSTASRVSMFANPAKHFGLTRKASTATLSAAPVAVSTAGLDHTFDGLPTTSNGGGETRTGGGDKLRPVRQATRAEDALRSVQARVPQAQTPVTEPEPGLAPLSESPASSPIPLPGANHILDTPETAVLSSSPTGTNTLESVSSTPPKPKFATPSPTPGFRSPSPARSVTKKETVITDKDTNSTNKETTTPLSTSPPAQPKFRTPSLTPEFGASRLARKSSMSSVRTLDKDTRPLSPSPLSLHSSISPAPTPTLTAPTPTPASVPTPVAPPSTPVPIPGTGSNSTSASNLGAMSTSPSGSSWLAPFRGLGRSSVPSPGPSRPPQSETNGLRSDDQQLSDDSATPANKNPAATPPDVAAPLSTENAPVPGAVAVVTPAGPLGSSTVPSDTASDKAGRTLTINTIAAQHAAAATAGNSPSGWLAWLTSTPSDQSIFSTPVLIGQRQIKGGEEEDMVMYIDSDGEEDSGVMLEGNSQTPAMTAAAERQKGTGGWGWGSGKGKGKAKETSSQTGTGNTKPTEAELKRPGMGGTALSGGEDPCVLSMRARCIAEMELAFSRVAVWPGLGLHLILTTLSDQSERRDALKKAFRD
ncbi:hypothetical protein RhiJN_13504 [Ceratobasidium sp. AG-Ba]|nr:hypothetical protein RhiJN_13504 [Ceratobasidium sp. AG-Ba]